MPTLVVNDERVLTLSDRFATAATRVTEIEAETTQALNLSELTSDVPARLAEIAPLLDRADAVLKVFVEALADTEINLDDLGAALDIPPSILDLQINALTLQGITEPDEVLAVLLEADDLRITSTSQLLEPFDASLPADTIATLDRFLLPSFLSGEPIDTTKLSADENAALRALAKALGADEQFVTFEEEFYSTSDKEDRTRTVRRPLSAGPINTVLPFVTERLAGGVTFTVLNRAVGANLDRYASGEITLQEGSEATGISEDRLARSLVVLEETQFRRTGVRTDLSIITGPGPVLTDDVTDGGTVLQASANTDPEVATLSDEELGAELNDIAGEIDETRTRRDEEKRFKDVAGITVGALQVGASFFGPVGLGVALGLGALNLAGDFTSRSRIEEADREIRELQERRDEIRQRQLDNALEDKEEFDIDTTDIDRIDKEIADIDAQIDALDAGREDPVDAAFASNVLNETNSGILGGAALAATGRTAARALAGTSAFGTGIFAGTGFLADRIDIEKRQRIDDLVALRDAKRREQLREAGDPSGALTEEEAAAALGDAEFEQAKSLGLSDDQFEAQRELDAARGRETDLTTEREEIEARQAEREAEIAAEEERQQRQTATNTKEEREGSGGLTDAEKTEFGGDPSDFADSNGLL